MNPIRILQVATQMNRGGLETMLMNYYRNIDRSRVQFDFLVHRDYKADYDDEILSLGGNIYRLPRLNPFSKNYLNALDDFFKTHKYTVVHSHLDCMSSIPLKYAKKNGVPVTIAHSHNSNQDKNLKYLLKLHYKKKITEYADYLFACSEKAGKWMFGTDKLTVIPNAIDAAQYSFNETKRQQMRESLNIGNELVFGHVGRFNPQKNHPFLIDIFAEIMKIKSDSKLLLVGGGSGQAEIEAKVKSLGLQNDVIFTGVRSDVNDLMQAMDVFVMPSLYEGLPVTMVEAQASGLPCLISERVPIECKKTDLVHQINLTDGARAWAEKAISLANTPRTDRYEEIKNAGYDIKSAAKRLEEFYIERAK